MNDCRPDASPRFETKSRRSRNVAQGAAPVGCRQPGEGPLAPLNVIRPASGTQSTFRPQPNFGSAIGTAGWVAFRVNRCWPGCALLLPLGCVALPPHHTQCALA
jgi:hypothetical protein